MNTYRAILGKTLWNSTHVFQHVRSNLSYLRFRYATVINEETNKEEDFLTPASAWYIFARWICYWRNKRKDESLCRVEAIYQKFPLTFAKTFLEGIRRSTPKEHFTNATGDMKLSRPTVCVYRPIQTSFSPSRVCSASFGVSNWWLHRRAVPARVLASFRSVCSQIERKSERIRVPVLATVQPVLLKTSDHRIVTQFLSLGSAWSLKAALLYHWSPDDPHKFCFITSRCCAYRESG